MLQFNKQNYLEKVEFSSETTESQLVIVANVEGSKFRVVEFIEKGDMYRKGLEENYKPLVSMDRLADNLAYLLSALARTDNLTEVVYENVITGYGEFLSRHFQYDAIIKRVNAINSNEGWVV